MEPPPGINMMVHDGNGAGGSRSTDPEGSGGDATVGTGDSLDQVGEQGQTTMPKMSSTSSAIAPKFANAGEPHHRHQFRNKSMFSVFNCLYIGFVSQLDSLWTIYSDEPLRPNHPK